MKAPERRTNGVWIIAFAILFVAAFGAVIVLTVRSSG